MQDLLPWYPQIRALHIGCAVLSIALFALRGIWRLADSPLLRQPLVRVVPHVIDTLLLASAITLALTIRQYPFEQPWLTAKLLALFAYIALGSVALKRGRTPRVRAAAFVAALLVVGYIVLTARTHDPWPFAALSASLARSGVDG